MVMALPIEHLDPLFGGRVLSLEGINIVNVGPKKLILCLRKMHRLLYVEEILTNSTDIIRAIIKNSIVRRDGKLGLAILARHSEGEVYKR